jgi:translation initiation factor 1
MSGRRGDRTVYSSESGRMCPLCGRPAARCVCRANPRAPSGDGAELKRRCGTGGSSKDGVIEIQGDHREVLVAELETRGYSVKLAGG